MAGYVEGVDRGQGIPVSRRLDGVVDADNPVGVIDAFVDVASSRRLEREAARNIELMWLAVRLAPDHKTIADFRRQWSGEWLSVTLNTPARPGTHSCG